MSSDDGPGTIVGWLRAHGTDDDLAGAAFLIGPDIALTCAHVVGVHLGLAKEVPEEIPAEAITIRFEALKEDVTGRVVPGGWFRNVPPKRRGLSDIAVIRLERPVDISALPAIAPRMPTEVRAVLIHGAENAFKKYGQQVQGVMTGSNLPGGVRQIDPKDSMRGFTVVRGFSGSPVMDDLGNVVWGMIVQVTDEPNSGVAYAVPANQLWAALQSAGVEANVRVRDAIDLRLEEAMGVVREQYETKLAQAHTQAERMRQELDRLRQAVKGLGQEARESSNPEAAAAALDALAGGDVKPATEVLRNMEDRVAAASSVSSDVAPAARSLGTMLKLVDTKGALEAFRRAADYEPGDFWTLIEIGRLEQRTGTIEGATKAIKAALVAAGDDDRTRGIALNSLGDLFRRQEDLSGALEAYQKALAIRERLASRDAQNTEWQRDLGVSYNKVGAVLYRQKDLSGALAAYEKGLAIAERLAALDVEDSGWQLDLSISHDRIGDVLQAQGELHRALDAYERCRAIRNRLAELEPSSNRWLSNLSVSHNKIGDVRKALGDFQGALEAYKQGLTIRKRLAELEPQNTDWHRGLSVSHNKIGDVHQALGDFSGALVAYEQGLAIRAWLARLEPKNTGLQRDVSFNYTSIGDVRRVKGDLVEALAAYDKSLAIIEPLAGGDQSNPTWRKELEYTRRRVAEMRKRIGAMPPR